MYELLKQWYYIFGNRKTAQYQDVYQILNRQSHIFHDLNFDLEEFLYEHEDEIPEFTQSIDSLLKKAGINGKKGLIDLVREGHDTPLQHRIIVAFKTSLQEALEIGALNEAYEDVLYAIEREGGDTFRVVLWGEDNEKLVISSNFDALFQEYNDLIQNEDIGFMEFEDVATRTYQMVLAYLFSYYFEFKDSQVEEARSSYNIDDDTFYKEFERKLALYL